MPSCSFPKRNPHKIRDTLTVSLFAIGGDVERDYDIGRRVLLTVCRAWYLRNQSRFGFTLHIDPDNLRLCCEKGAEVLDNLFPNPPGPFKRVAAFIVMGRLHPFFHFSPVEQAVTHQKWLARTLTLVIPVALQILRVNTGTANAERWIRLDSWNGWPSQHFKYEFLNYLEYLRSCENCLAEVAKYPGLTTVGADVDRLTERRLARMVLATAMIIEGCYYWNESADPLHIAATSSVRGNCNVFSPVDDVREIREFYFDRHLYDAPSG